MLEIGEFFVSLIKLIQLPSGGREWLLQYHLLFFYIFIISFIISFLLTPIFKMIAIKAKILDMPNERKIHLKPTPLLGGVVIYISFAFAIIHNLEFSLQLKGIVLGATLIMLGGLIDDTFSLSAKLKLFIQIIATIILIKYGVVLTFLPNVLWGQIGEILLTIFWVVGITNALNFMDGMDGLATGITAISSFCFFIIALQTNQSYLAFLTIALVGACLGFLPYNFKPAGIFLGDAGSSFLGFTLASLGIKGAWSEGDPIVSFSIPILILGVLIFDLLYITIARIRQGKVRGLREWIEYTGKDHLHHRLFNLGLSEVKTVIFIYLLTLCLGISAIILREVSLIDASLLLLHTVILFGIVVILMLAGRSLPR